MRFSIRILSSILAASVASSSCVEDDGNYYCSEVSAVTYSNVGYSGTYEKVSSMDESSCDCTKSSYSFSGTNSPLDEELSVHFRGPLRLLQFGVYYPSSSSSSKKKREADPELSLQPRHAHHRHKRDAAAAVDIVSVYETIYVDSNGNTVTAQETSTATSTTAAEDTTSTTAGDVTSTTPTSTVEASTAKDTTLTTSTAETTSSGAQTETQSAETDETTSTKDSSSSSSSSSSTSSSSSSSGSSSGDWTRTAYYTPGSTDNVVFLNNLGAVNSSGTWSSCFGNSLSFAAENGVDASSEAVILNNVTIESDVEYIIFSGEDCDNGDSGCGYYRSDIPAYHGFGGSEKIFVFEFYMPHESSASGTNADMPAIWLLNAKIPRTTQYGSCSCWSTGCGELDLFEILSEGDERLISHIHDGQGDDGTSSGGGGSSDYFTRPTSSSMKGAAIFTSDGTISIVVLDDSTDFGATLSSDTVSSWLSTSGATETLSS